MFPQRRTPAEHLRAVRALQRGRLVHQGVRLELPGTGTLLVTGLAAEPVMRCPLYIWICSGVQLVIS